jgi:hypothetical protein
VINEEDNKYDCCDSLVKAFMKEEMSKEEEMNKVKREDLLIKK